MGIIKWRSSNVCIVRQEEDRLVEHEQGRRIIFPRKGEVRLQKFEPQMPGPGDVLVKTRYSLMSIGTETIILHARYDPETHFDKMFSFPQLKTGVQATGIVAAKDAQVSEFEVGDRVFMRAAHGSHQTLKAVECSPIPDGIDMKHACWCGLAKTAFRAAHVAPFLAGGKVLIIGAGPVGQMTVRWAAANGMKHIAVVDIAQERLSHAKRGGATHCFVGDLASQAPLLKPAADEDGFSLAVDTTGNSAVFSDALDVLARFGKLVLLGDTGYPGRQCLTSDMMTKGLTVVATHDHHDRDGWTQRRIDAHFFDHACNGAFRLNSLITHEFAPEDCEQAYALASDRREQAMGILYDWKEN